MEFPFLLAVLLYQDCAVEAGAERNRLTTLATALDGNIALQVYVNYLSKTGQSPNPDQLRSLAAATARTTVDLVEPELEQAAQVKDVNPAGSFKLVLQQAWEEANGLYLSAGYAQAQQIAVAGASNAINMNGYEFERRMKKLYGDDPDQWDRVEFSQMWLDEYRAANPFTAKGAGVELEAGEYIVSTIHDHSGDEPVTSHLTCINGQDIAPVAIDWWWEDRFALGKIAWLAGLPGTGKTMVMLDVAARITTGRDFPDNAKNTLGTRRVLIAMSEDGLSDTVVPRLLAAGADMGKITFLNRVVGELEDRTPNLQDDIRHLREALTANPDAALLIMDPMTNYFGSDVNINVDKEARPIMTALKKLCEEFRIGFMGVIHNNKQNDANAIQKILGCSSIVGAARSVYGCSVDPDDKTKRYFTFIKGNCSAKTTGLEYDVATKLIDGKIKTAFVEWGAETEDTAEDCMKRERDSRYERKEGKQIMLAQGFIPTFLKGKGQVFSRDLYNAAMEQEGISSKSINAAIEKFYSKNVIRRQVKEGWTMRWVEEEKVMTASMAEEVL